MQSACDFTLRAAHIHETTAARRSHVLDLMHMTDLDVRRPVSRWHSG